MENRYPEPEIPIHPILSFSSFTGFGNTGVQSIEDAGEAIWVTSGRVAIAQGLQMRGIAHGDEVLLPAYSCWAVVEAVKAVGAEPVFYKCQADLSVDLQDVATKITSQTRCLLVVHFFGFPQNMIEIAAFSHKNRLVLVEDCAHAYFSQYRGRPLGSFGSFAIASAMKFFPVSDGGCLVFPGESMRDVSLHSGGSGFEAKSLINNFERSVRYGRFQPFTLLLKIPILFKDWIWSMMKKRSHSFSYGEESGPGSLAPESSYGGVGFDDSWMEVTISRFSRFLIRRLPRERIVNLRRRNFQRLLESFSTIYGARPLFNELPEGVVPYVFPLLVPAFDQVFPVLKREGVPILRWEDVDENACDVSARYSMELLQFPCHQEISAKELDWMIGRIQAALKASN